MPLSVKGTAEGLTVMIPDHWTSAAMKRHMVSAMASSATVSGNPINYASGAFTNVTARGSSPGVASLLREQNASSESSPLRGPNTCERPFFIDRNGGSASGKKIANGVDD